MIRKDGLTSWDRKVKYSKHELKQLALEAHSYFLANGWERLTNNNMHRLHEGTSIRCCEYNCGCFGQIEKIKLGVWDEEPKYEQGRDVHHTNHDEPIGDMFRKFSENRNSMSIMFALIRSR